MCPPPCMSRTEIQWRTIAQNPKLGHLHGGVEHKACSPFNQREIIQVPQGRQQKQTHSRSLQVSDSAESSQRKGIELRNVTGDENADRSSAGSLPETSWLKPPVRPAFGPTGLRGCTDGKLRCPWDNSRPSSEILPSHTQDNYSHLPNRQITVTAELHLQKKTHSQSVRHDTAPITEATVECMPRLHENHLKPLSNLHKWECKKKKSKCQRPAEQQKCVTLRVWLPKVSTIWHFSSHVHECTSMLWFVRPHRPIHATPWGPDVKEEAKIWTYKSSMYYKGLTVKPINVRN